MRYTVTATADHVRAHGIESDSDGRAEGGGGQRGAVIAPSEAHLGGRVANVRGEAKVNSLPSS